LNTNANFQRLIAPLQRCPLKNLGSGAWLFAVVTEFSKAATQITDALLISTTNGHGEGKFQLFDLMVTLDECPLFTQWCVGTGLRVNGSEDCHGSLSFYFDTSDQPPDTKPAMSRHDSLILLHFLIFHRPLLVPANCPLSGGGSD
jgi:hypothetical protein